MYLFAILKVHKQVVIKKEDITIVKKYSNINRYIVISQLNLHEEPVPIDTAIKQNEGLSKL